MSKCKYCGKESYDRPFCPECGKKYFGFSEPIKYKTTEKEEKTKDKTETIKQIMIIQEDKNKFYDTNELMKYNLPTYNPIFTQASHQNKRIYLCKNGNKVRSKSERDISDFLTEHQIEHAYEKAIQINKYPPKYIFPDFYLPGIITYTGRKIKNIYIEHLGGPKTNNPQDKENYNKKVEYKIELYKQLKITVVFTYEKDMINPNFTLKNKLLNIKENQINY